MLGSAQLMSRVLVDRSASSRSVDRAAHAHQAFEPRERDGGGPERGKPCGRQLLHRDASSRNRAPTGRCRRAHSRRSAARDWCPSSSRPAARATRRRETPSPRSAPAPASARGSRTCEDQMLGRILVRNVDRGVEIRHQDAAAGGQRLRRIVAAREPVQLRSRPRATLLRELARWSVTSSACAQRVVLGLRQQIGGDEIRARAVIGDHQHLRWAGGQIAGGAGRIVATSCLAAVTQALPGPKILSTFGMLSCRRPARRWPARRRP